MGCTESLPEVSSFNVAHKVDPTYSPIGSHVQAGPSVNEPMKIVVKEKLFSWSGDDFKINHYQSGVPLGNGLKMKGKVFAMRDQMALLDGNGNMVAVCLRKFEMIGQTFKIYVPNPVLPNQQASAQKYNGTNLYTYCQVKRVPLSVTQEVYMEGKSAPSYTVTRSGSFWPKKRTVRRNGQPAAIMEGGTWEVNFNSYRITICPGIDPCLMVCLSAICDEMDEQN